MFLSKRRFSRKNQLPRSRNPLSKRKSLRLEALEARQLLAASIFQIAPSQLSVTASTHHGTGDVAGAFNGDGLTGGLHNNIESDGWLTTTGAPSGKWLKVDLGGTYDLDHLDVWNGNRAGFTHRGIKQADIYYALTDPGNNINESNAAFDSSGWVLAIENQNFTKSTGSSAQPSTDTFELGGVSAGYLAIRVDSTWAGNPVGLAEIQVFASDSTPVTTYALTVGAGAGDGDYAENELVAIVADAAPSGEVFLAWTGDIGFVDDVNAASTTFTMPSSDAGLVATYAPIATHTLSVTSGSGDGDYIAGNLVSITADAAPSGEVFSAWTGDVSFVTDVNAASTTFTMPSVDASLTATYTPVSTGGGSEVIPYSELTVTSSGNYSGGDIEDVFNGVGLSGDLHSNLWHQGWLSDGSGTAGEWVKVDLGGSYTLDSLELWNGNQAGLPFRGIKQGDLFIAQSDPGNNVNDSGAAFDSTGWTPLVTDQQFTQASGADGIASTDTISLGNTTASFLAIRVDSAFAGNFVAISEIQISRATGTVTTYDLTVNGGSGDGAYTDGDVVAITADAAPSGEVFLAWTGDVSFVTDVNAASTTFTMPSADASLTATYTPIATHTLTVTNGTGDGLHLAGDVVSIAADAAPSGEIFAAWTGDVSFVADVNAASTTFTMPSVDASITATYTPVSTGGGSEVIPFSELAITSSGNYPGGNIEDVFNGVGLTGDLHSNLWSAGWLSNGGGSAGEWIKIDLGGSYSLDSLELWNGNQPALTYRGLSQGDVFVAQSDPGNNVNNSGAAFDPAGWTALISDQTFTQSSGADGIASTDTISLSNTTASFLAIRVDSAFAGDFVAISEIQISRATGSVTTVDLTVNSGSGDGSYAAGSNVSIAADVAPAGEVFLAWTGDISFVADIYAASTSLTMPSVNASVTATYGPIGSGGGSEVIPFGELSVTSSGNFGGGEVAEAFNGVGLDGDLHSNLWAEGWLSNGGGTAGEWIKIDLGGSYSLTSLELWNGNQPALTTRGLQQADILVAQSDPGNNLDNSSAAFNASGWTPLISNQQFTQASGVDGIASTDTINLGNTTASFLAIRVDSAFSGDTVAISEIQISRVPVLYGLNVDSGSGDGAYTSGTSVTIIADAPAAGDLFLGWTGDVSGVADVNSATSTFIMSAEAASIAATYGDAGPFVLVVNGGSGDGSYTTTSDVTVTADPAPAGMTFFAWTGDTDSLSNAYDATATLEMPPGDISIDATYITENTTGSANLALNKTVFFSSEEAGHEATGAVDGVEATYWRSANTTPWLTVDLGQEYTHIDRVNVQYYTGVNPYSFASDFEILYSSDNVNWQVAHSNSNGYLDKFYVDSRFPTPVTARYIRFQVNNVGNPVTVSEFQVYQSRPVREFVQRGGTPNLIEKLANGDNVKIAYMGGSITAKPGGWVQQSGAMIQAMYPGANVSEYLSAEGGKPTDHAVNIPWVNGKTRIDDVVDQNPDVVFLEFAVNDRTHVAYENSLANMETMVRKIWDPITGNPNTDIVFVYTFRQTFDYIVQQDQSYITGTGDLTAEPPGPLTNTGAPLGDSGRLDDVAILNDGYYQLSAGAFEEVADYYGIPTIHMGIESAARIPTDLRMDGYDSSLVVEDGFEVFSPDGIHPHISTGHVWYTEAIERSFDKIKDVSGTVSHALPAPIRSSAAMMSGSSSSNTSAAPIATQSSNDEALLLLQTVPEDFGTADRSLMSPPTSESVDSAFQELGQIQENDEDDNDDAEALLSLLSSGGLNE